jgi:hypothetical protein
MQKLSALILFITFITGMLIAADDSYWDNRNSGAGAKAAYEYYKSAYQTDKNYETAWKLARSAHFYADKFIKDSTLKKNIFTEGKTAAESATNLGPDKPDGYYYLGICLGSWAEANGILKSLFTAPDIVKAADKCIAIDPQFENGSAYMLRARVYQKAPGGISVGDPKKANADYIKAIEYGPNKRTAHRFYAEFLIERGNKTKAREIIDKGLAIEYNDADKITEDDEIGMLNDLKKKLN